MKQKRYVIVGLGGRAIEMFGKTIMNDLGKTAELAAVCDINPIRMAYNVSQLPRPVPQYTDFNKMMREVNPDGVVVGCRDCFHAEYVVRALRAGKRVYSEKPLCTTAADCRAILATARESKEKCFTTHNARYGAACRTVYSIVRSGRLGKVLFMQFEESLDRMHGADYFRRWHRNKANSGGLQIHKASHHFDLLNWWAGSTPARVTAQGGLHFYGRNNPFRGKRCRGCPHASKCQFHVDMTTYANYRQMYLDAEKADGYIRDACVWDKSIDIEDQLAVQIAYRNGIEVNYSLVAYSPIESMRVVIEGTKGRLEFSTIYDTSGWPAGPNVLPGVAKIAGESLRLFLPGKGIENIKIAQLKGSHGGADPQLMRDFFARPWGQPANEMMASVEDAVQAVLIGAAVNKSLATGKPVQVQELLKKD